MRYCKFRNFHENFIFANALKAIFATLKSRLGHDLPISNDRMILPFCEDFYFHAKIKPSQRTLEPAHETLVLIIWASMRQNLSLGFPAKRDSNQSLQLLSLVGSLDINLSKKRITKALIRLCRCAGWSAPLLFANP